MSINDYDQTLNLHINKKLLPIFTVILLYSKIVSGGHYASCIIS